MKTKTLYRWLIITRTQEVNCIPQLGECIRLHGALEIMKSDQVDQYTSHRWTCLLLGHGVKASMDGGGADARIIFGWSVFGGTIKLEYVYLNPAEGMAILCSGIAKFMNYYNY